MRGRIILMFVAVLAVAGGGLYYVFGVHLPNQARSGARDEILRWEERLARAQLCLLGDQPTSSEIAEALTIYEVSHEVDHKACTPRISELSRGDGEDTGIAAVERAWRGVDSAISGVAAAFGSHLDPNSDSKGKPDPLPAALAALAAADAALRDAAGMDPPRPLPGTPLRKVELIPIRAGATAINSLQAWLRPTAGGMFALAERDPKAGDDTPQYQLALVPGAPPKLGPIHGETRASITDPAWGVAATDTEIQIGPTDPTGGLSRAAGLDVRGLIKPVLFALGSAQSGALGYVAARTTTRMQIGIARVSSGAITTEPPQDAEDYAFGLDPGGRGLLAWSAGGKLEAAIIAPGEPTKIVDLGSGHAGQSCLTATHGWVSSGEQFVAFDNAGATPHVLPGHELIGCDATSVLLRRAGQSYSVCTDTCRVVELDAKLSALPALAGGQVIAVGTRDRVLVVWREKGPPLYFSLPSVIRPTVVHATAKLIDVIAETDSGLVIARVAL